MNTELFPYPATVAETITQSATELKCTFDLIFYRPVIVTWWNPKDLPD